MLAIHIPWPKLSSIAAIVELPRVTTANGVLGGRVWLDHWLT